MATVSLESLAVALYRAKKAEELAKAKRIAAEEAIAALVETGENASKTVDAGDLKVVVKRKLNYKADVDSIRKMSIPAILMPIKTVPETVEFDEKAYEQLRENHPETFMALSKFVETKPGKVSVTLKL